MNKDLSHNKYNSMLDTLQRDVDAMYERIALSGNKYAPIIKELALEAERCGDYEEAERLWDIWYGLK